MTWQKLESRELDLDWSKLVSLTIDPYIVWADATRLSGLQAALVRAANPSATNAAPTVPIAFEFAAGTTVQELRQHLPKKWSHVSVWPIVIGPFFGTAEVPFKLLGALFTEDIQKWLVRFELGLPTKAPKDRRAYQMQLLGKRRANVLSAQAPITYAAVIDDGCAFANNAFVTRPGTSPAQSRIHRLWLQEDKNPVDSTATHLGYAKAHLDGFLTTAHAAGVREEPAAYAELEQDLRARGLTDVALTLQLQMRMPAAHGTHVLDVMAGAPNPLSREPYAYGQPDDVASTAPIIFVQLPNAAVADTSGASMNCNVLEAIAFIATTVKAPHKVVINLSYGSLAGPHDGTTLLEEAIDSFLAVNQHVQTLTLPAGNGYDSRTHARLVAPADATWHELQFQLLPDDPTDTFVEVWYEPRDAAQPGVAVIDLKVVTPEGEESSPVPVGSFIECIGSGSEPMAALIHVAKPTAGAGKKHMALLALTPTRVRDPARATAPHGTWTLKVCNRGGLDISVDAWIERDDSPFGSGRSRSQATFLSAGVAPAPGQPHAATPPIERQMCLNSIAHGIRPEVAGGYSLRASVAALPGQPSQAIARYSASGPGRKGPWEGPNLCAPCEQSPALGLRAAGTRSAQPAYMNGTSVACAALARQRINGVLRPPVPKVLDPVGDHPSGADYPDPKLRRGAGRLDPAP